MKPALTENGVAIQTFEEIAAELREGYQEIYGQDINVEPDSPDGQRIGIEAKGRLDAQEFGAYVYNQLDPDKSMGTMLHVISKLAGITPRPATRSQVDVTVTTDRVLTLPAGYKVLDELDQAWALDEEFSCEAGENTVTLFAREFGPIEADAETVTIPDTIVPGVLSVTNASAATVGRDEETEPEIRVRRRRSVETPATSQLGGLFAALSRLPGVVDLDVAENDTSSYDSVLDLNQHTCWVVIEGGDVAAIAETIAKNKTIGAGTKGQVTGTYTETKDKPNGGTREFIHVMRFDRPNEKDLYVRLKVSRKNPGVPVDTALIAENLEARKYGIGEPSVSSALYADVFSAGTNFVPFELEISDDEAVWTDGSLAPGFAGKWVIKAENVTVTEV